VLNGSDESTGSVSRKRRSTKRSEVVRCRPGIATYAELETIPDAVHRHSASKTRVNALMALHRVRETAGALALGDYRTLRSVMPATPSARLTPTLPSTDSGCSAMERCDPPTSALAPTPTPSEALPEPPT
jgi:hypothetical protein